MKKLVSILAVVLFAFGAWRLWRGSHDDRRGQELLYGRVWLDHLPQKRTETFHVLGMFGHEPFGWFAERNFWKGSWEIFRYEPRGNGQVDIVLPSSGEKARLSYRAWRCTEQPEFDYCLEVTGGKGPTRYFSRRGWERHGVDEARALESELAATALP